MTTGLSEIPSHFPILLGTALKMDGKGLTGLALRAAAALLTHLL